MAEPREISFGLRMFIRAGRFLIDVIFRSARIEVTGLDHLTAALASDRPVYVGFWHGRLIYPAWYLRRWNPTTVVSRSKDGEIIARMLQAWGFTTIRGSSRRGGAQALRGLLAALGNGNTLLTITMDGPVGPVRKAKMGSLAAARKKGAILLPLTGTASRHWTFRSWDQFQLPKPFAKIRIDIGPPFRVDTHADDEILAHSFGQLVTHMEDELDAEMA